MGSGIARLLSASEEGNNDNTLSPHTAHFSFHITQQGGGGGLSLSYFLFFYIPSISQHLLPFVPSLCCHPISFQSRPRRGPDFIVMVNLEGRPQPSDSLFNAS